MWAIQQTDLRIGLEFDEPEVKAKLAKALAHVTLGDASRLRHQVSSLAAHLADENPYVQERVAEALGLLTGTDMGVESGPILATLDIKHDDSPSFLSERVQFCRRRLADEGSGTSPDSVATMESIRDGTDDVVEEMNAPDDSGCPHCGLSLSEGGPPMCPRCGAPH